MLTFRNYHSSPVQLVTALSGQPQRINFWMGLLGARSPKRTYVIGTALRPYQGFKGLLKDTCSSHIHWSVASC